MITADNFTETFSLFQEAPSKLVETILESSVEKHFKKGDFIYLEGDSCPGIAFVLTGEIRVFKVGQAGRELTLYEIFAGETCILNASCILSRQKYPANAIGLADGSMLYLGEKDFRTLVEQYEVMRTFIFKYFSNRFTEIIELIEAMAFQKMDVRLTEHLIAKATDNTLQTTHQTIANELGTSREVVSRLLKEMEHSGKVRVGRNSVHLLSALFR